MNAPLIWIGFPMVIALVSWFSRRRPRFSIALVTFSSLLLAFLAFGLLIGKLMYFGTASLEISPEVNMLGRRFVLNDNDRPFLILFYLAGAFWFFGGFFVPVYRGFESIGMAVLGLMVAAFAVEPFLYAALLLEIALLLCVPMLVPPGRPAGQGIIRFLIFQTLAVPFMLFAGWISRGVDANPADSTLLFQAVAFMGLGFAFWLAIFPFNFWVPQFTSETEPFVTGFVLCFFPMFFLFLLLNFMNTYVWLRTYPLLYQTLQVIGVLMIVTAGVLAAVQNNIGRLFGYALIIENGFALLALSLGNRTGYEILVGSFFPRIVALAVWSLGMAVLNDQGIGLKFADLRGLSLRYPVIVSTILISMASLAGMPLLAGFPIRQAVIEAVSRQSIPASLFALAGSIGFLISGFRVLLVMTSGDLSLWEVKDKLYQSVLLSISGLGLILAGILPDIFLSLFLNLLLVFDRLK